MDALTLLKEDHDKVKGRSEKLDDTTERAEVTRTEGLAKLKQELTVHEAIEEESSTQRSSSSRRPRTSPWKPSRSITSWTSSWRSWSRRRSMMRRGRRS